MPTRILGISAYYHDSAAALVEDGRLVAAAQEERFTRKKHDSGFPSKAVDYCLREAGITGKELDLVGFYEKPLLKFERLLETYVASAPRGLKSYLMALPTWLGEKLWMSDDIRTNVEGYEGEVMFGEHHESHAASAFYPSPFENAAIVTMDGVGEWATSSISVGKGHELEMLRELRFPHSLGLLYSAFTYFTGFRVNSGEYKVMGLAPYGEPKYVKAIKDHLLEIKDDGSLWMNMEYFMYPHGLTMTGDKFGQLFDGPARKPETKLTQREMDLARSVQEITEEVMLKMARFARKETGQRDLCLAGGVALNCVGNGRLLREGIFDQIWIQPAAGDAGGAVGVALALWHRYLDKPRTSPEAAGTWERPRRRAPGRHSEIRGRHERLVPRAPIHRRRDPGVHRSTRLRRQACRSRLAGRRSRDASRGRQGHRPAAGPHGVRTARSGRPLDPRRRAIAGHAVGDEPEDQVPRVVPAVRALGPAREGERVVRSRRRQPVHAARRRRPRRTSTWRCRRDRKICGASSKLNVPRSMIPAVTHVDYSARIQTVRRETNPLYYDIIAAFDRRTGCPVIVNTSFNVRGEPIVCTPDDAYRCFMRTNIDVLVLENFVLEKADQPPLQDDGAWKEEFVLD